MPLVPSFTASQPVGEPSVIRFTDTSTGSDAGITQRRIYLRKSNGRFLVPTGTTTDYIVWDYSESTLDLDGILDKDYALTVTVEWMQISPLIFDDTFDSTFN